MEFSEVEYARLHMQQFMLVIVLTGTQVGVCTQGGLVEALRFGCCPQVCGREGQSMKD